MDRPRRRAEVGGIRAGRSAGVVDETVLANLDFVAVT
jgi:hypothetical protein